MLVIYKHRSTEAQVYCAMSILLSSYVATMSSVAVALYYSLSKGNGGAVRRNDRAISILILYYPGVDAIRAMIFLERRV